MANTVSQRFMAQQDNFSETFKATMLVLNARREGSHPSLNKSVLVVRQSLNNSMLKHSPSKDRYTSPTKSSTKKGNIQVYPNKDLNVSPSKFSLQ